ncbi:hypothetical protein IFR04_005247 [Cadophora malorum]|uniref:RING-type domain-containing protein n=1 Tax=Cadophora malorum TaxID=108018 RepID=A0A8H7TMP9_9HELO|nr:hypothetical protein IFR04_005247 [Cadophora malorum]
MCKHLQLYHKSCQHNGLSKNIICFPDDPDFEPNFSTLEYQELDKYPMPDYCPSCLLESGDFDGILGLHQRWEMLQCDAFNQFGTTEALAYADKVWKIAESDKYNYGEPEYFAAYLSPHGSSRETQAFLLWLLNHLKVSFWHQIVKNHESPSRFRRQLLIQLQNYQIVNYSQHARDVWDPVQAAKDHRGEVFKTMVEHPSITTLSDDEIICVICHESLGVTKPDGLRQSVVKTSCNHLFGEQCLSSWIEDNATCPLCRHPLLTLRDGVDRYLEHVRAVREAIGIPNWLVNLSGLSLAETRRISQESVEADALYLTRRGIPQRVQELSRDAYSYRNFGFLLT